MQIECLQLSITALLLGQFILGIIEAIYLDRYSQYKLQCYYVWEWLVAGCVINIVIPLLARFGITFNRWNDDDIKKIKLRINAFQIAQLIISVWAAVVFFDPNKECRDYWLEHAKELWYFVVTHFGILWFLVANILMYIMCGEKCTLNFSLSF